MDFFSVLSMIGGLALFLYGMHVMGDGLSKVSGGKMEKILEGLTSNPLKAVGLGALVTAVIQSSITSLDDFSLSGIESDSFLFQMFKFTSFSPILAIIGVAFLLFAKSEKKKDIGTIFLGFAVLMFGMDSMSAAVKPLADVPAFTNLAAFSNPLLGMLAGALLTAVIQSSSASVGILQALCVTGAVSYGVAIPIILGQNIGTCVTALLSAIGAKKNAKRAAMVHLYFNIIGTTVFLIVFYGLNMVLHFEFLGQAADAAGIAVAHSAFNIFATAILLPFSSGLEKLACLTIRDEEETEPQSEAAQLLDVRFLEKPAFAMEQSRNAAKKMAEASKESLFTALSMLGDYREADAERVVAEENNVDEYEDALGSYLVKLGQKDLNVHDSRDLSIILHCIGDFERISDHAVNIMESAKELHEKDLRFSEKALEELKVISKAVVDIVNISYDVFENTNIESAKKVEPLEEIIDELNKELKSRHVRRLREGKCTIEQGFILSDITTSLERIADHCSNIAVCILQVAEDSFDTHSYLNAIKKEDNATFQRRMEETRKQYPLP